MVTYRPLTEETILQITRLKLSNVQTISLSEWLSIDTLFFLMIILAVGFFWNC